MSEKGIKEIIKEDRVREEDKKRLELVENINEDIQLMESIETKLNDLDRDEVMLLDLLSFKYKLLAKITPCTTIIVLALIVHIVIQYMMSIYNNEMTRFGSIATGLIVLVTLIFGFLFYMERRSILSFYSRKRNKEELLTIVNDKKGTLKSVKNAFENHDMKDFSKDMRGYRWWREYQFYFVEDGKERVKFDKFQ